MRRFFGARDSPTCANFAVRNEATWKFYLDDYLESVECPEIALKLSQELIAMLKRAGFALREFNKNVNYVSETLEPSLPVRS